MSEKTKITESLLKLMGFDKVDSVSNSKVTYINTETDMVITFGEANIPVIRRQLTNNRDEYIGGYEYYEDALEAFNEVILPQQISDDKIDLKSLRATCQSIIDEIVKEGYSREDNPHYVYEEAMQAIFGEDIFDFINKHSN